MSRVVLGVLLHRPNKWHIEGSRLDVWMDTWLGEVQKERKMGVNDGNGWIDL